METTTRPLALVLLGLALAASAAHGVAYEVDRFDDEPSAQTCDPGAPSDCSLRGAILKANGDGQDSVVALPGGTYPLSATDGAHDHSGDLDVLLEDALTLEALAGQVAHIVQTVPGHRVMDAAHVGDLTLRRLVLSGGQAPADDGGGVGGALRSVFGNLVVEDVAFVDNEAPGSGGCVYRSPAGSATSFTRAIFEGCDSGGSGGALFFTDPANDLISASRFRDNRSANHGGAIVLYHGLVIVEDSVFEGNHAEGSAHPGGGGAIAAFSTGLHLRRSSVVRNRAGLPAGTSGLGGGLYLRRIDSVVPSMRLENVTVSGNRTDGGIVAGSGIYALSVDLEVAFSTLSDNTTGGEHALFVAGSSSYPGVLDLEAAIIDDGCEVGTNVSLVTRGYNVERPWDGSTTSTCGLSVGDEVTSGALGLRPPAVYGGPHGVQTQSLQSGSPASGRVGSAACISQDARTAERTGFFCDSGAHEEGASAPGPWIFADGFESGDDEAWSSTVP